MPTTPCQKNGIRLDEALNSMQLAYNPITKQLQFMSSKVEKVEDKEDSDKLSKKSSFSDEGNFSFSTCDKSDSSDSPKNTLQWSGSAGHERGKNGGSFSSTISSLSESSVSSSTSKEEEKGDASNTEQKLKKKGFTGFFSRGVFQWKSGDAAVGWRLFPAKSTGCLAAADTASAGPGTGVARHRRHGSTASENQFEDIVASSIALIQHDRPSNLPAKCSAEALRHRAEHERVVAGARRRAEREAAARQVRVQRALRAEESAARRAREWLDDVLPRWARAKNEKRTLDLWWSGLPPSVRGKVWQLAIENKLKIDVDTYQDFVAKAKKKLHDAQLRRKRMKVHRCSCKNYKQSKTTERRDDIDYAMPHNNTDHSLKEDENPKSIDADNKNSCIESKQDYVSSDSKCDCELNAASAECRVSDVSKDECSMELIQLDIARTFPNLCIFQPGGPYFDVLHEMLAAYVCYRPDIGYVQGMSFIAAVLILNMEAPQAFVCFANLLDGPVLKAAYTRDGSTMQRLWAAYTRLVAANVPRLARVPAPELYLLEWVYTAFAKAMPLDAACRLWDVFLRDGDAFLFRAAIGILHLYQEELKDLDFISAAQFLTKLPEDLDPEALFKSISCINMTLDGMSFEELVSCCQSGPSDDEVAIGL